MERFNINYSLKTSGSLCLWYKNLWTNSNSW